MTTGLSPIIKWVGGKRWLVPKLKELYTGHQDKRLVEPFVGGMSVALGLLPEKALLCDSNEQLIWFYNRIAMNSHFSFPMANDKDAYYEARKIYNMMLADDSDDKYDSSELFYYLNKTGFNGLYRVNSKGEFNVPFGKYKNITYRTDFSEYAAVFSGWDIKSQDYMATVRQVGSNDFVYVDPPYDNSFDGYQAAGFGWSDQYLLAENLVKLSCPVVASNSATDRIVEMYSSLGFDIQILDAPRSVSGKTSGRKKVPEVLATKNL